MGPTCSTCVHSQIHLHVQNWLPIGPAVLPHFPGFWIVDPLPPPPPKRRRGVSWGELFLAYVHSQMNPQTCTECGPNRSIRLAAFPDLNLWPPKTPRNAPYGIEGRIVFSYAHSQTNPQTCTKFGDNRSSSLTASPDIWIWFGGLGGPLTPPPMLPEVVWGDLYLAYVHSQMNPQTWTEVGANRSSRLTASTDFWICDPLKPPKMPPGILRGELYLIYVNSQTNPQTFTKFGANQSSCLTASPDIWMCDWLP